MNLITAQQHQLRTEPVLVHVAHSHHERDEHGNYILVYDEPLPYGEDYSLWHSTYGPVQGYPSARMHGNGNRRPCVHALEAPMRVNLFAADWVAELNWQPRLCFSGSDCVCIASRQDHIVTVAFDVIGPTKGCGHKPGVLGAQNKWVYEMHPLRFDDMDDIYPGVYAGVWPD